MIFVLFALIAIMHGTVAAYFAWRVFYQRFRFIPIDERRWNYDAGLCALLATGWIVAAAREIEKMPDPHAPAHYLFMPRIASTPTFALALVIGVFALLIIYNHESQQ